jgi:hypothetical protein
VILTKRRCRGCGGDLDTHLSVETDYHGHEIKFGEWSTCQDCGLTKMETPWTEIPCPTPRTSSRP